jgi:hypothetical protein
MLDAKDLRNEATGLDPSPPAETCLIALIFSPWATRSRPRKIVGFGQRLRRVSPYQSRCELNSASMSSTSPPRVAPRPRAQPRPSRTQGSVQSQLAASPKASESASIRQDAPWISGFGLTRALRRPKTNSVDVSHTRRPIRAPPSCSPPYMSPGPLTRTINLVIARAQ